VGKSTLLNCVLGEKVAITSPKPQTTRNRITGIKHLPHGQIVFIDTPGVHQAKDPLSRILVKGALTTLADVDVVSVLIDARMGITAEDREVMALTLASPRPTILVANKIDQLPADRKEGRIAEIHQGFPQLPLFPLSALTGTGVKPWIEAIEALLPEGPPYFPPDMVTDRSERFLAAELIREQIMLHTREEVPYATAVTVEQFQEDAHRELLRIMATITVERPQQKSIIIGAGGAKLKQIGIAARQALERRFGISVYLSLFVRARKHWTREEKWIREFGYYE